MNTAPNIVIRALINNREMNGMIADVARSVLAGNAIPEEVADIFTFEVLSRSCGAKFVVVDFA